MISDQINNNDLITKDDQTNKHDQIPREYAGFWVRFAAMVADGFIFGPVIWLLYGILLFVILFLFYSQGEMPSTEPFAGSLSVNIILLLLVTTWFWRRFRATPGKMALDLEIVDADSGENLTIGRSIVRCFAYIISALPVGLGFIWVAFDKRKQGWHDKLANTVVIKKRTAPEPVIFVADD